MLASERACDQPTGRERIGSDRRASVQMGERACGEPVEIGSNEPSGPAVPAVASVMVTPVRGKKREMTEASSDSLSRHH